MEYAAIVNLLFTSIILKLVAGVYIFLFCKNMAK